MRRNHPCGSIAAVWTIVVLLAGLSSCNTMRYVPRDRYLLRRNVVEIEGRRTASRRERVLPKDLKAYVQQRPNSRLLGIGIYLGMYNLTDTAKHNGWQRFWREKVGEAPVIYDPQQAERSRQMMQLYLTSRGYFDAEVEDSAVYSRRGRKATVHYVAREGKPYTVADVRYRIDDSYLAPLILEDTAASLLRRGMIYDRTLFDAERERISTRLQDLGFWGFNKGYISYVADTTGLDHAMVLTLRVRRRVAYVTPEGEQVLENHPLYRIRRITVNTDYDPTQSVETIERLPWDTLRYRGIDLLYLNRLRIKEHLLAGAIRFEPGELYDRSSVRRTYDNIRNFQYSSNILFNERPEDTLLSTVATRTTASGATVSTRERNLSCLIQCTPNVRQNFNIDAELSTTADYYSMALTLGYQNKNLFRGAENFTIDFRGAYELMKNKGNRNSYEFGVNVGLDIPRFLLPVRDEKLAKFAQQKTHVSVSYDIQRRPDYNRTIAGGTFGYSWAWRNGARFQIDPVEINVVDVPWIDPDFKNSIENPYLKNSYESQLIAGLSAGYYYQTDPNPKANNLSIRLTGDVNGNLLRGLTSWLGKPSTINAGQADEESFYRIFGIRYAQYARLSFDISQRANLSATTQLAWRFFLGGGVAYGNSKTLPFERLYFAGGANSMRGWQVRTLGPGETPYRRETYPNQLGDFRIEANLEYRFSVAGNFGMAVFLDAGNVWMNAKGAAPEARFRFDRFYRQIALDTGLGFRYDFGFVLLRLDWGLKLHDPNVPVAERWIHTFRWRDTALHFAIGLPF